MPRRKTYLRYGYYLHGLNRVWILSLSLQADAAIERERAHYRQTAFEYVCNLQDVHAQKQYEIIEPVSS